MGSLVPDICFEDLRHNIYKQDVSDKRPSLNLVVAVNKMQFFKTNGMHYMITSIWSKFLHTIALLPL